MKKIMTLIVFLLGSLSWALTSSQPALETEWNSVALIKTEARDSAGTEAPSYCNASFLSPKVLITAAHCLHHAFVLKSFSAEITTGYYKFGTRPDGTQFRVGYVSRVKQSVPAQFYFSPSLKQKFSSSGLRAQIGPNEDMAIMILNDDFPDATLTFAKVISTQEFNGLKSRVQQYAPTVVTINYFSDMSTDNKRMASLNSVVWNSGTFFESKSSSRVEEGDSGAPLFVRIGTEWKIAGTVKGRGQSFLGNWDAFSSTGANLCSISPQLGAEFQKTICF